MGELKKTLTRESKIHVSPRLYTNHKEKTTDEINSYIEKLPRKTGNKNLLKATR